MNENEKARITERVAAGGFLCTPAELAHQIFMLDSMRGAAQRRGANIYSYDDMIEVLEFWKGLATAQLTAPKTLINAGDEPVTLRHEGEPGNKVVIPAPEPTASRLRFCPSCDQQVAVTAGGECSLCEYELPTPTALTQEGNNPTRAQLLQQIEDLERMAAGWREVNEHLDTLLEHARHFFGSSVVRLLITTPENTPMEECFPNLRKAMVGDLTKMQAVKRQRDELMDAFEELDRGQNLAAVRTALEEAYYPVRRAILEGTGYPHRQVEQDWAEYITSHDREVMEANESRVEMAKEIGRLRRDLHEVARELEEARVAGGAALAVSRQQVEDRQAALIAIRHAHPDPVIAEILELVLGAPAE